MWDRIATGSSLPTDDWTQSADSYKGLALNLEYNNGGFSGAAIDGRIGERLSFNVGDVSGKVVVKPFNGESEGGGPLVVGVKIQFDGVALPMATASSALPVIRDIPPGVGTMVVDLLFDPSTGHRVGVGILKRVG